MTSVALQAWRSTRANRLDRLQSAHTAIGGSGPGRRWLTEELNHALILRLAAEFQGFARELHDEVSMAIADSLSGGVAQRRNATALARYAGRLGFWHRSGYGRSPSSRVRRAGMVRGGRPVKHKHKHKWPRVGDRVIVDFGGHDVEGDVVHVSSDLYDPPMITVDAWLTGSDEPLRSTYRADSVRLAEPARQ
jgi:hypothetical protein